MALQKQAYNMTFAQGVDLKTDPNQVEAGQFLALENAIFQNGGGLKKRNGFGALTTLSNSEGTTLTTLNDNLLATGSILQAYSQDNNVWLNRGTIQPVNLWSSSLTRNSTSQVSADSAASTTGLVCTVYVDAAVAYYQVTDTLTGQMVVSRTALPTTATNPRVFTLDRNFIITFGATVAATPNLRYIAVPISAPSNPSSAVSLSTQFKSISSGYDAVVANNNLFFALNGSDVGGAIRVQKLSSTLVVSSALVYSSQEGDLITITPDSSGTTPNIYISWWDTTSNNGYTAVASSSLVSILSPTQIINSQDLLRMTSVAKNGTATILYEVANTYSYSSVITNNVQKVTITVAGVTSGPTVILRGVGLASKAFFNSDNTIYALMTYSGAFQPTYFLVDSTGNVIAKIAYSNGGGLQSSQVLPNVSIVNDFFYVPYLIKDLLVSVNKSQGAVDTGGIYTQTGINLLKFIINSSAQYSSEIGGVLQLTGGIVWEYDGVKPVEHSFHLWPEDLEVNTSTTGGALTDQQYYYAFCYEWTDAKGSLHRSAPSLPLGIVTAGGNTSTNTIEVPTYRPTYKTGQNPVRIVGYRWSTAQQNYYQFTSITSPVLNDSAVDSVQVIDTLADSAILGNTLLYTTGGVVENIAAPAAAATTLYKSRQVILSAENRNLLWYSKQVIQNTPVEFSDLFTIYVAPTTGAQGSTGDVTALSAMDDKLIIFKASSIYYITGTGPDNTGANSDFSEPVFISGTAGTTNPDSVVFTPQGIMFESDKGIWLLGRDLSTKYIGANVESFNGDPVTSALTIPGTNEVRFSLLSGAVLMYDYYYNQWSTFTNVPAISSTLYHGLHTYLNPLGEVRQETPGRYLDGNNPVLLKFTTAWLKLTGLQGYQRVYFFYFLSEYITPYKMNVQISYDYNNAIQQTTLLTPANQSSVWGDLPLWGSGDYGGGSDIDQRRVFLNRQKCQSILITVTEVFDASKGVMAGAGFEMSGVNFVVGAKKQYPTLAARQSAT